MIRLCIFLSAAHFVITQGVLVFGYRKRMAQFGSPDGIDGIIDKIFNLMLAILLEPVDTLWGNFFSSHFRHLQLMLFLLNSLLWGFTLSSFYFFCMRFIRGIKGSRANK
jgi:hypothetical protein